MNLTETKLWTALITPMTEKGGVDYASLELLCRQQEREQNGILVLGSTGESLNLNRGEKREIFSFVKGLNLKVPLMAGVGGINLEETIKDLQYLETLNYDCYLMVTPLYAKPGSIGQLHWFQALMNEVTKPTMLYNIPGRTGVSLSKKALLTLKDHPRFWAIKEASGSPQEFESYVQTVAPHPVYSGDDGLLPYYKDLGVKGLVSVASNAWPSQTNRYVQKTLKGELENPKEWEEWSNALFMESNPIPVKRLLFERGDIKAHHCRLPLSHEEITNTEPLMKTNRSVQNWS